MDQISSREIALDHAVKLNVTRGQITAPFPTGSDVVVDAEAFLGFLEGREPAVDSTPDAS